MLRTWIAPETVPGFLQPRLPRPGVARSATSILDWEGAARVLRAATPSEIRVCARGREVPAPVPRDLPQLRALLASGLGVVVEHAEQHDAGLAAVAASFAADVGGRAHLRLSATPGGAHALSWRYGDEDVFVAQTAGVQDYFYRRNTQRARAHGTLDFTAYAHETSQLGTSRMTAGDWLYVPSRWWHMAVSVEDSLSVTIAVLRCE